MSETLFKIRRRTDGLFSKGGVEPTFSKTGKVWKRRGDVSGHLSQLNRRTIREFYENCEVVEFSIIEDHATEVIDVYDGVAERRDTAKAIQKAATDRRYLRHLRDERRRINKTISKLESKGV